MVRGPGGPSEEEVHKAQDRMVRFRSYIDGGTSSTLTTIITFPIYKTVFRQQLHSTLVRQAVAQLYKEGLPKLYRGALPPLLKGALNGTLMFGLQDTLLQQLSPRGESSSPGSLLPALAGLGTGVVEALVFTPFERVQNVLQNGGNDRRLPTLRSILVRLCTETFSTGYYRALLPVLVRNALGTSLYFGMKDPMYNAFREQELSPRTCSLFSGLINAMIISIPLYPLSVLVANMQAQIGRETPGVWSSVRTLWESRQRSIVLLYRGGSLVILRSLTWGITTAIYDELKRRSV